MHGEEKKEEGKKREERWWHAWHGKWVYVGKDDTGENNDGELWVWYGNGSVNNGLGCMRDNHVHMGRQTIRITTRSIAITRE